MNSARPRNGSFPLLLHKSLSSLALWLYCNVCMCVCVCVCVCDIIVVRPTTSVMSIIAGVHVVVSRLPSFCPEKNMQ